MTLEQIKKIVLSESTNTCYFNIKELTKNEYVAVGSNGNILRWKATGNNDQKWIIVPIDGDGNFNIITVQNGEYMSVGSNGNILRWGEKDNKTQWFSFVDQRIEDGAYNIQEHTKNQYVAVGSNGNILRWKHTGKNDQRFILEPINIIKPSKNEPKQTVGEKKYEENQIPAPPVNNNIDYGPKEESDKYLIDIEILPSVLVNDPNRIHILQQVEECPYYFLVRNRFWRKVYDKKLFPDMVDEVTTVITEGASRTDIHQIETTVGVVVNAKGDAGGKDAKVSGELSAQYSWTKQELSRQEFKTEESITETKSTQISINSECRVVGWQTVDEYVLYDYDDQVIDKWEMKDRDVAWWDKFPKS